MEGKAKGAGGVALTQGRWPINSLQPGSVMSTIQHAEARKLLDVIASAVATHRLLTYRSAAKALGRDPANNSRMVAQVCDLLDAAAALAGTPLLALVMVRELSGEINRKAWTGEDTKPGRREAIINRSLSHRFTSDDFRAISEALERLDGKSNRAAWKFVRETIPLCQMYRNLEIARLSYLQRKYVFVSPLLVHVRRPADASILTSPPSCQ
jgi:hypothetical protein